MLVTHREFASSFGLTELDQTPVSVVTVLSINESAGDCAAYRGIGPAELNDDLVARIKAGGNKIGEAEARQIFDEIEDMQLRYRR